MNEVTVKKENLLDTLLGNMKTHEEDFNLAWEGYSKKVTHNLEVLLKAARTMKRGKSINLYINLEAPVNHKEDYERAIEMLNWDINDVVVLREQEFEQLVMDRWTWKENFSRSNVTYTGLANPSKR